MSIIISENQADRIEELRTQRNRLERMPVVKDPAQQSKDFAFLSVQFTEMGCSAAAAHCLHRAKYWGNVALGKSEEPAEPEVQDEKYWWTDK